MALDYYNKKKCAVYLGLISGEAFEEYYRILSDSEDKIPLASTILPSSKEGIVQCWIFYELKPQDPRQFNKQTGQVEAKKIKMEM